MQLKKKCHNSKDSKYQLHNAKNIFIFMLNYKNVKSKNQRTEINYKRKKYS